jgi:hypothetical protein
MTEITKAVFTLRDFEVLSFAFQKHSDIKNPLNVNIQANGIFDPSTFEFILHLRFLANEILDDQNSLSPSPNITVHMACYFKFEDGMTLGEYTFILLQKQYSDCFSHIYVPLSAI